MKWDSSTLEEVAEINPRLAATPKPGDLVTFVPMSAVSEQTLSIVDGESRPFHEVAKGYTQFQRDDIIIAKITPCFQNGKMAHATNLDHPVGVGSTEFHVFRPREALDGAYLFHLLRAPVVRTKGVGRMKGAAGQRRVPAEYFAALPIPLPPLAEQKRIAGILDAADALRAKRREALAQLDSLLQATFLDLFSHEANAEKLELSKVADVVDCKHRTPKYVDQGYPVVRPRNVKEEGIDLDSCIRTTKEEFLDLVENHVPSMGDIVYSRNASFGVASRVTTKESFAIGQDVCVIVPTQINSAFLWYQLNSHLVRRQLDGFMSGSTFKRINLKAIRKLEVVVLSQDAQKRFDEVIAQVDKLRLAMGNGVAELDTLFASLQSRAFRGEL